MIQARELRIGSWVYPNDENNTPYQVNGIDNLGVVDFGLANFNGRVKILSSTLCPIPLTPKILKKAGFEKRTYSNDFFIVCGKESKKTNGLFIEISIDDNYSCSIGQLKNFSHQFGEYKSLHQLQNLYHSLTGQELEIKL